MNEVEKERNVSNQSDNDAVERNDEKVEHTIAAGSKRSHSSVNHGQIESNKVAPSHSKKRRVHFADESDKNNSSTAQRSEQEKSLQPYEKEADKINDASGRSFLATSDEHPDNSR